MAVASAMALGVVACAAGCAARSESDAEVGEHRQAPLAQQSGAQLWQRNCARCHNPRSPSAYTDDQWQVAMHHMRVRANLTAAEHERILAFLQASN